MFASQRFLATSFAVALCITPLRSAYSRPFTVIVTEAQTPLVPNSLIELAERLGYYRREGVDVKFVRVRGTPLALSALIAGQGDMANVSLQSLLALSARGKTRFRAVSSPSKTFSFMIVGRDSIDSPAALRGKKFGIGQVGSLDYSLSWQVMRSYGVDPKGLHVLTIGHPQARLMALLTGKIDATTASYGSWTALAHKAGLHIIVPKDAYFRAVPVVAKVNVVAPEALRKRRLDVVKVTAALLKLARWFAAKPQRWADVMISERPDVPPRKLRELANAYSRDWCVDGCFDEAELRRSAHILAPHRESEPVRKGLTEWADFSILNAALRRISRIRHGEAQRQAPAADQ